MYDVKKRAAEILDVEDTQPDPEELNLESIATDAAYALKQLRMSLESLMHTKAQDCIIRAIDAVERIQDRTKPQVDF